MSAKKNLIGQRFGKLIVLQDSKKRTSNKGIIWHCKCDCGNEIDVPSTYLIRGTTKSCGCLKKGRPIKDISNKRFGKLIALQPTTQKKNNSIIWKCKCDCGKICYKSSRDLISGSVSSCGCLIQSKGQYEIQALLKKHNILYKKEFTFKNLKSKNNGYLRFDFAIFDKNDNLQYLIEFDGQQHFQQYNNDWFNHSSFQKIKQNDLLKNKYCKQNNIFLIRIPFYHLPVLKYLDLTKKSNYAII